MSVNDLRFGQLETWREKMVTNQCKNGNQRLGKMIMKFCQSGIDLRQPTFASVRTRLYQFFSSVNDCFFGTQMPSAADGLGAGLYWVVHFSIGLTIPGKLLA